MPGSKCSICKDRAKVRRKILIIDGLFGSISGDRIIRGQIEGKIEDAENLGVKLAEDLLSKGAKEILDKVYGKGIPPINGELNS